MLITSLMSLKLNGIELWEMGKEINNPAFNESRKKRKKRKRTVISPEEGDRLEYLFKKDPLPDRLAKMELAKDMGRPEAFVNIWFQNRRARERKLQRTSSTGDCAGLEKGNQSDLPLNLSRSSSAGSSPVTKTGPVVRSPLFGRIIRMAAAAEGGILAPDCPYLDQARTDAWKGIQLEDARVFYHPAYGFDVDA